jgi:hypothetical protein
MSTTHFAARACIGHAVSHHILVLLLVRKCAKRDLKSTVPDLCITTEVRGINTFIHMPFTRTNGYDDNAFCCQEVYWACCESPHPTSTNTIDGVHGVGKNRSENDCTSFLHHNQSQRDRYMHTHAFHQYQWL